MRRGVTPATVVTAGFGPLRHGWRAYAEQLEDDGVSVRYRNYEDMVHGFLTLRGVDRVEEAVAEVSRDLAEAFECGPTGTSESILTRAFRHWKMSGDA